MLDQSNRPPEWYLKFQNDRVTWFWIHKQKKLFVEIGLSWSVMNDSLLFGPGSGQYTPNTPVTCHHKFQSDRCIWEPTLHCIALPLSLMSLSRGCVSCNFFTPFPLMTPSSPNTKPSPLLGRCCYSANSGTSGWSSVPRPGPRPGRARDKWL